MDLRINSSALTITTYLPLLLCCYMFLGIDETRFFLPFSAPNGQEFSSLKNILISRPFKSKSHSKHQTKLSMPSHLNSNFRLVESHFFQQQKILTYKTSVGKRVDDGGPRNHYTLACLAVLKLRTKRSTNIGFVTAGRTKPVYIDLYDFSISRS